MSCAILFHLRQYHLISSHVVSSQRSSPHLIISAHLTSSLLFALFSIDVGCSHLPFCHLIFSHLITAHHNCSQFFVNWTNFIAFRSLVTFQVCFWRRCNLCSIIFSSSFSSPHLSISVSLVRYLFTFVHISSNLFPFPARQRSSFCYADSRRSIGNCFPQKLKVEDAKTNLSCKTSCKTGI